GDRLLPDRDVQEPRQLARPEPFLDLLLEAPDQEHLAEELAQPLLGERSPLALDLGHLPQSMLRPMRLVGQWQRIEQGLRDGWADARLELSLPDEEHADRAAALLGPLMPGRSGKRVRFFTA